MPTLNIGVLAHVDAGKTSLTERLLFDSGAITALGSVDAGSTRTDSGEIERRRGITIRTAVASLRAGDLTVNLIDTPGHSDFAAEVDRALAVLDVAVLVVSAVEGVQARTRVLMKALRRIGLPVLLFVNKVDRAGARPAAVLADVRRLLTPGAVALNGVRDAGTAAASTGPTSDPDTWELLAEHDDGLLALLVTGVEPGAARLQTALRAQAAAGRVHPVVFGSALTGVGVADLVAALQLFRGVAERSQRRADAVPATGTVFALDRGAGGTKTAYVRLYDGRLRVRDRVRVHRDGRGDAGPLRGRITALAVAGDAVAVVSAGEIAQVAGLPDVRVGDRIGAPVPGRSAQVAPPSMETKARAVHPEDAARLHAALVRLAEQDPLISTRPAPGGGTSIRLHGEVQRDVIAETLRSEYGVEAVFEPLGVVCLERVRGAGSALVRMGSGEQPAFVATVGLRVEPRAPGTGVAYQLEAELGSLPLAFHRAIEESVREHLRAGGPAGWPVTDCTVVLTHTGYSSPVTVAADFRGLTPVVLAAALAEAGTLVFEPCHDVEVEVPPDTIGAVSGLLLAAEAQIRDTRPGPEFWTVTAELPARRVHEVQRQIAGLTRGEGVWTSRPHGDRPIAGQGPRPITTAAAGW